MFKFYTTFFAMVVFIISGAVADVKNLTWYDGDPENGGTQIDVGNSGAGTCTVGSPIVFPDVQSIPGYNIKWLVIPGTAAPECDMFSYYTSDNRPSDYRRYKALQDAPSGYSSSNVNDLNPGEFAVSFTNGELKGTAMCSGLAGDIGNSDWLWSNVSSWSGKTEAELTSATGDKTYCWCAAYSFTPNNGDEPCVLSSPLWVLSATNSTVDNCLNSCASSCATATGYSSGGGATRLRFRTMLFGGQPPE